MTISQQWAQNFCEIERMMSVKWVRVGAGLLLLMVILGCFGMDIFTKPSNKDSGQQARKSVIITIDINRRQEFFDQLRKFAEKHGFAIQIDTLASSDEEFQIYMTRDDVFISGATAFALEEYYIGFYDRDNVHFTPDAVFDDLASELERFVSEIPNTTFLIMK
jgi:hypothetical protein